MRTVSERFRRAIGSSQRWVTIVEWTNSGGYDPDDWHSVPFVSGSVTADSTAQVRWHAELTLSTDEVGPGGINPFTTRIRVRNGIAWSARPGDHELLGMGIYRVQSVSRSRSNPLQVTITGDSFEEYLIRARFAAPGTLPAQDAAQRVEDLIKYVLKNASIYWKPGAKSRWVPKFTYDKDRWAVIDGGAGDGSVAKALGCRIYCDGDGVFVVAPTPTLEDKATWTADAGPGGVLINSTEELSNDGVYNRVVVTGQNTEEDSPSIGPCIAEDRNPYSPTYIWRSPDDGGFGPCAYFYSSQLITTWTQGRNVARTMLAPLLGLKQQITFDSLHDPTKEPGDVGTVRMPDGRLRTAILDSITYDLNGGNLQCTTRTTDAVPPEEGDA